jgi:integrase
MSANRIRLSLTDRSIQDLKYSAEGGVRQVAWDKRLTGFGVRVTPAGGKQYVVSYRFNGRPRLMSLGRIEHFRTLQEAAAKAEQLLHDLRHKGRDPMMSRQQLDGASTFKDLWETYFADRLENGNVNSRRSVQSVMKKHVLPRVGHLKPTQITTADVVRLHDAASKYGKVVANRAVERLADVLSWAHKRYPASFPDSWQSPCRGVDKHREHPRKHHLTAAQLAQLAHALDEERSPYIRTFTVLMMLTGARKTELLALKWKDVNLEDGTAVLRKTKSGTDIVQRLSPLAVRGLRELPVVAGSEFVFPGIKTGQHMADPRLRYKLALKRAGLPAETTFHDLRRSYGTNLARLGYSAEAIAAALHNTSQVAARHYVSIAGELIHEMTKAHERAVLPAPVMTP